MELLEEHRWVLLLEVTVQSMAGEYVAHRHPEGALWVAAVVFHLLHHLLPLLWLPLSRQFLLQVFSAMGLLTVMPELRCQQRLLLALHIQTVPTHLGGRVISMVV